MARMDVKADVNGVVWKIETVPGSRVSEGDVLLIIESMKMEIAVHAPAGGTVTEILVREEQAVTEGQAVAVVET
jgi:biotin carboxyl carrier protein